MSVKKTLKENTSISIIDLFEVLFPNAKTKYYELFLKIIENKMNSNDYKDSAIANIQYLLDEAFDKEQMNEKLKKYCNRDLASLTQFMSFLYNDCNFDITSLKDFIEYNEKNLIEKNDITTYNTYDEIVYQTSLANIKQINKEFENQIIKLYENTDDGWLVIKPLTHQASVKYGYGAKWCTAMKEEDDYFRRYTGNGILIYCINKKTGNKVAAFKEFNEDNEYSFWNMKDKRIDSMQTELPYNILEIITFDFKLNIKSNKQELLELLNNDEELFNKYYYSNKKLLKKTYSRINEPIIDRFVEPELELDEPEENDIFVPVYDNIEERTNRIE